jgi:F-type H+-transporting ATPase subunit epsilon
MSLRVSLVSPEAVVFEGEAEMVLCRTTEGEIAFLTDHAPFLGALADGDSTVMVRPSSGSDVTITTNGGFVEVKENRVIILSDAAQVA